FLYDKFTSPNINQVMPQAQFTSTYLTAAKKAIVSDAWTISNQVVNEFRASYSRAIGPQLAVPAAFSNFPNVEIDPLGLNVGPNGCSPQGGVQNVYQFSDTVSYTRGKHTFKGGAGVAYDVTPTNFPSLDLPPQLQSEQDPIVTCSLPGAPTWCTNPSAGFLQTGGLLQVNVPPVDQATARAATQGFYPDIVEPK